MTLPEEEEALVAALRDKGFLLHTIWDWANDRVHRPDALPVLIDHLARVRDERTVEGIARALTDKRYRDAEPVLVARFPTVADEFVRWAIGNAIAVVGFSASLPQVISFIADPRFGRARETLIAALPRAAAIQAESLLLALLDDPVLDSPAAMALARIDTVRARTSLLALDPQAGSPRFRKTIDRIQARLRERPPVRRSPAQGKAQ